MLKIYNKFSVLTLLFCLLFISFTDDNNRVAISQQYQNLIPSLKKDPKQALPSLEKLREKAEKILDAQDTLLANILFSNGKIYFDAHIHLDKALIFNQKALEIRRAHLPPNHIKLAQSFHNTAMILYEKGRFAVAKQYAYEATRIKAAQPTPDSASIIRSLVLVTTSSKHLGAYDEALETAHQTTELATILKDTLNLSNSHSTIGNIQFALKNYAIAAKEYDLAYHFLLENAKSDPSVLAQKNKADCLTNLGIVMRFLNKSEASLSYLSEAKNTYLKLFANTKDSLLNIYAANCIFESGNTEGALKNDVAALQHYDEALTLFGNAQSPFAIECWNARGDILQKNNKNKDALNSYQKAINVFLNPENNVLKNPILNDLIAPELLDAFAAKAQILGKMSADSTGFRVATFETLTKCDTLITRLMTTYDTDNSKYFLVEKTQPIYAQAINIALKLAQNTTLETARFYQNAALNFCEKNRAIALINNLKDQRAKNFSGISPSLLATERDLKSDIAFAQKELYDAPDSLKNARQNALYEAKQAFTVFQKDLEKKFPKYFDLKYQSFTPLSIEAIQSHLEPNSAVIEYFIADANTRKENAINSALINQNNAPTNTKNNDPSNVKLQTSNLYIFAFSKNNFQIFENPLPPQYIVDFQAFRRSLSDEKWLSDSAILAKKMFLNNGYSLFKMLLESPLLSLNSDNKINKKIENNNANNSALNGQLNTQLINRLRIIPDGILNYLPFEMLLTNNNATDWKGNKTPFLLRDYAVSYAYSARLLDDNERTDGRHFGGFGIEYDDKTLERIAADSTLPRSSKAPTFAARGNTLAHLTFADDEVRNIGKLLINPKIFLNSEATKANFLKNAPNCGILHLAMHGAIDEKNPLNSGLIFSKTNDSTNNYLSGYDLFGQQLHAGLAVLSACNTGNGELQRGEGVMSLARAFAFAGCPSTVMSLWSIPDESTSQVMLNFYKYLNAGDPKDIALQKAKLDYLKTCPPQYQVPNYWGAPVIIGNIAPVDFREWYQKPVYLGVLSLLILLSLIVFKFKKKLGFS